MASDAGANMPTQHPRITDITVQDKKPLSIGSLMHHLIRDGDGKQMLARVLPHLGIVVSDQIDQLHPDIGQPCQMGDDRIMRGGPVDVQRMPDVQNIADQIDDRRRICLQEVQNKIGATAKRPQMQIRQEQRAMVAGQAMVDGRNGHAASLMQSPCQRPVFQPEGTFL